MIIRDNFKINMKILILKIIYVISLFSQKKSNIQDLENISCESNKQNIDYLEEKITKINEYEYTINPSSVTNIQGMLIIGILEKFRPNNICEYGAGVSTTIFETYCQKYNKKLLNIEHDDRYKRKDSKLFKLEEYTNVTINNKLYENTNRYVGLEEFFSNYKERFDFVFIDGPYGTNTRYKYTRIQMIDLLEFDLLQDNGYFLIHDTERENAQNSLKILLSLFKQKGYDLEIEELQTQNMKRLTIINFKKQINKQK